MQKNLSLATLVITSTILFSSSAYAVGITKLVDFSYTSTGAAPSKALSLGSNGLFYGTTGDGGTNNNGTLFSFNPTTNALTKLVDFSNASTGIGPYGALSLGPNGLFYSTGVNGGGNSNGTLFSFNLNTNALNKLVNFSSVSTGSSPVAELSFLNSNGLFYGTTAFGGTNGGTIGNGTLFSFNPNTNALNKLVDFSSISTGSSPRAGLSFLNSNGLFYGTTSGGGTNNNGTLFSFNPTTNALTKLVDFSSVSTGSNPQAALSLGRNGLFYGTTGNGGTNNNGTLFSFNPTTNALTKLVDFSSVSTGSNPYEALSLGSNGLFYGTTFQGGTNSNGTLFSFNLNTNALNKLVDFNLVSTGSGPYAALSLGSNGLFYGTTLSGGTNGNGTLFSFDPGTSAAVPEPLTILGGMTALGLGGVLKRKVKKNG